MQRLYFSFDHKKATQALNDFATRSGGKINKMKALKLVFLADRYHLRKYGRLITNDSYVAMKHGPVPSAVRDIVESNEYLDDAIKSYSLACIEPVNNWTIASISKPDTTVFSETDMEALNFAWEIFGHYDQFQLRDITHTYPEWTKHKKYVAAGSCSEMNVLDFLLDPTEQVDGSLKLNDVDHKTYVLNDDDRHIRRETLIERSLIDSLWR